MSTYECMIWRDKFDEDVYHLGIRRWMKATNRHIYSHYGTMFVDGVIEMFGLDISDLQQIGDGWGIIEFGKVQIDP